ncbi:MAG TPA: hypothetical protein VGP93_09815 [Polyangiaceae bacterium]|nr:hypothetical protein [Polyangiaceae bacterium]
MSKRDADLKRLKLTKLGKAWVKSESHATGKSEQEIVADLVHERAVQRHRAAKVFVALALDEDHTGDSGGRNT